MILLDEVKAPRIHLKILQEQFQGIRVGNEIRVKNDDEFGSGIGMLQGFFEGSAFEAFPGVSVDDFDNWF